MGLKGSEHPPPTSARSWAWTSVRGLPCTQSCPTGWSGKAWGKEVLRKVPREVREDAGLAAALTDLTTRWHKRSALSFPLFSFPRCAENW